MPDFIITNEVISEIAKQYNIDKDKVDLLNNFYKKFTVGITQQYLAHIIRTMEDYLRKIPGNEMFYIRCTPVDKSSKKLGIAEAYYYKNRYFDIYYHPDTEEKQLRVQLAHELGHLFLVELVNSELKENFLNEKTDIEPYATILGIFVIYDKNEFYHNKTVPYRHISPNAILDDFKLFLNRKNKKLNLS